jgi:hypothetical protein
MNGPADSPASNNADAAARGEKFEEAYERTARYLVLTNGGGAVAASAFLGSTIASHRATGWAVIPLFLFYSGLLSAGSLVIGQMLYRWKMLETNPQARSKMVANNKLLKLIDKWIEPPFLMITISYLCLLFGGIGAGLVYLGMYCSAR